MRLVFPVRWSASVMVALLSPAAALHGQEPQDTATLTPVTVTATRVPVRLDLVSSAVTVLTAAQLRAAGYKTVADALRDTPAAALVETGSFGGQTSLFLRGGESDYVKVLLDGVTLNQPGGAFDFADLSLDNVERIEVVRGPASVLYGSDAMAGVIQIFTRGGAGPLRFQAGARGGSYGTGDFDASLSGGAGALRYAAGVERFRAAGTLPVNNHYERSSASAQVSLRPDARTELGFALRYGDATFHYPTDGAGTIVDSNTFRFERGPVWSANAAYALNERVQVRVSYGTHDARQGIDDGPDSPGDTLGFYGFHSRDHVRRTAFESRVDWRVARGAMLTAGVALERQRIDGTSASQSQFGPFPDSLHHRRRNDALYAQLFTGLDGPLTLQAGARLDENAEFGRFATVRAGAAYRLDAFTRVRIGAGTGFKEPTFFESFAQGFVRGNPELDPERTRSWEVGIAHRIGRSTVSAAYFDQQFRDLIEYTGAPTPPDSVNYFNITGASADGLEAEWRGELGRGVVVSLRYTYLDTRVTDPGFDTSPGAAFAPGRRLLRRPSHQAALQLDAPLGHGGAGVVTLRYTGDRDDLDFTTFPATRVTLRAALRLDLGAEYDLPLTAVPLSATLRVENLFNDQAREAANYPARGRVLMVGGRLRVGPS